MQITEQLVEEIKRILFFGLTKGRGHPKEGKMCVEAAICFAQGLPHSDKPSCVGSEVRKCKIALNDCNWTSNLARAEGMKYLAIAQLGSDKLNQEEFFDKLKFNSFKKILPFIIQMHYDESKEDNLLEYKQKFESIETLKLALELWKEFYSHYYNNYYYYNYNNYYYYYNYNNNYYNNFLLCIADTILQTLIEMKSEGCQYLWIIDPIKFPKTVTSSTAKPVQEG